ncbi:MAG TPA: hypothetical protein VIL74_14790 [Pyrinomonadaceae bacterium]|jgi:phosphotriesterase-related protein
MSFVRTILGDIDVSALGVCYAHEHVILDRSYATEKFPHLLLDSVDSAAVELKEFYRAGGRAMIDAMPCGGGRNVLKLAEISRRTGVQIVSATGLHLQKYYPHGHWSERLGAERLAEAFIADIEQGIDANDYCGIEVERTRHRAGIIKVAGGLNRLSDWEKKVFSAAAVAHRQTGAPILTHTEKGTAALEQIELLKSLGVDIGRVILSHTDRIPDFVYHREILSTGVNVELDGAARWRENEGNPTRDLVVDLFEAGHGGQIMLGMDAARRSYWKVYGGAPGLDFLLRGFSDDLMAAGLDKAHLEQIFVHNPARVFAFSVRGCE